MKKKNVKNNSKKIIKEIKIIKETILLGVLLGILLEMLLITISYAEVVPINQVECYSVGVIVPCAISEINASDDIYAYSTLGYLDSYKSLLASAHTWHNGVDIPDGNAINNVTLYIEWRVADSAETCSIEIYEYSTTTWHTITTACAGIEALYSYNIYTYINTEIDAENMQVRLNYTSAAPKDSSSDELYVDYISIDVNHSALDTAPPVIALTNPSNGTIWASSGTVIFEYNVSDTQSGISNCSLIIDGSIDQIDYSIIEEEIQTFSKLLENGDYTWAVNCTDNSTNVNEGASEIWNLIVNYTEVPAGTAEIYKVYDNWFDKDMYQGKDKGVFRTVIIIWNLQNNQINVTELKDIYSQGIVDALDSSTPSGATKIGSTTVEWTGNFPIVRKNMSEFIYDWYLPKNYKTTWVNQSVDTGVNVPETVTKSYDSLNYDEPLDNAAYLISQISKDNTTWDYSVWDVLGGAQETYYIRFAAFSATRVDTVKCSNELKVNIPPGWDVTNADGWTLNGTVNTGWNLTKTDILDGFYDSNGDHLPPTYSSPWNFTLISPSPSDAERYVFNATFHYCDSMDNVHDTVGEHLVQVIASITPSVGPWVITDKDTYDICSNVYYKITVYDKNDNPIDSLLSVGIYDPSNNKLVNFETLTGNGETGVYLGLYSLDQTAELGKWLIEAFSYSVKGLGEFFVGTATTIWKIDISFSSDSILYPNGTNIEMKFTVWNKKGEKASGLLPNDISVLIDSTNVTSSVTEINDEYYYNYTTVTGNHIAKVMSYGVQNSRGFSVT